MKYFVLALLILLSCLSCTPIEQMPPILTILPTPEPTAKPTPTVDLEPTRTPKPDIPTDENGYILTCSDYDLNNDGKKDFFGFREDKRFHDEYQINVSTLMLDFYNGDELNSMEVWDSSIMVSFPDPNDELPLVKQFAVGDYDDDGFPEIVVSGEYSDGYYFMTQIYNLLGDYKEARFLTGALGNYVSYEGYFYTDEEFGDSFLVYSDYNYSCAYDSRSTFAGMFEKDELVTIPENSNFTRIDYFETITYPNGNQALLCRQSIFVGYMWFALKWGSKIAPPSVSFDNCAAVEEWFQPVGAERNKYRGYRAAAGYPYGYFGKDDETISLYMYEFNDSRAYRRDNRYLSLAYENRSLVLTHWDIDKREDVLLGHFLWNVEELVWGMGADVNRDGLREMLVVGKDINGKGKLGIVTALAKKPQLYTLEFDTQSIETAEIVPYKDMYIINCLVKDTSGKQEWQAYKFDNGKFVGLTQKDVAANHPAKLFREKQK